MMRDSTKILLVVAALVGFAMATKATITYLGSRGIRNNNPGNIRKSSAKWLGAVDSINNKTDADFLQFASPVYGIRAIAKILKSYAKRGLVTVPQIIATWAPTNENDTAAYVASVLKQNGWLPNRVIQITDYPKLIAAIVKHENGSMPYDAETIRRGIDLA